MSGRVCEVCDKRPAFGNNVSHANNRTRRRWSPNIHRVKAIVNGTVKRIYVCTRCLRSGRVVKAPPRPALRETAS